MKKQTLLLLFIFLMFMSGKMASQSLLPNPHDTLALYLDGKLYFQLKLSSSVAVHHKDTIINDPSGSFQTLFTKYHVTQTERPFIILNTPELNKTYRISFNQPARVDSFILELSQISSDVEYAEKVPIVYSFSVASEFTVPTPQSSSLYHLALLNANLASDIHVSTGNAIVAIVDDAVLISHEDLTGNIYSLNANVTTTPVSTDPSPDLAQGIASSHTHGTHVAGIAGGRTNNGVGIASIGWNNKLMCVRTNDGTSPYLDHAYDGLAWAAANGAHVINMSWGSLVATNTEYNIISAAKNLYHVVLVAAAGNFMSNFPTYPASFGEGTTGQSWEVPDRRLVVAVAALDQNSNIAASWPTSVLGVYDGSSFGSWVDIAAYGTDIMSTLAASTSTGSAIINQYGLLNGTSMAAPMVAGIAGIMRSYDMSKTADEIIDCLINTANPDIYGSGHPNNQAGTLGVGRADAAAALRCISSDCSVNPIVIITPSSPNVCAGTSLTLTANNGASTYSWSTGATTQSINVTTPGVYTVTTTYPAHCSATASITIEAPPTLSLSVSTNTDICPGTSLTLISAAGSYSALVWQPGALTSNSVVINPTAYTVFSVTANPQCGGTTATIGVNPVSGPSTFTNAYSVLGSTINGTYVDPINGTSYTANLANFIINTDAVVNTAATFLFCDVLFAPSVKLTVPGSSTLNINDAYLHTCGADMWQGIVVEDGAKITSDFQCIIEDAVTGISSTHTPLSSAGVTPGSIQLRSTVFNKNYTDISLTNYYDLFSGPLSYSNSLKVDNCVFTCRDFSLIGRPSAGVASTFFAYGIRIVQSPTTGLSGPYINANYPYTTLKAPYAGQTSHCAIVLSSNSASNTIAGNDFVIGDATYPSFFNLFDNHDIFINAQNTNVTLKNNVFQNQRSAHIASSIPGQSIINTAAVMLQVNNGINVQLDMTASGFTTGNRFWNCYRGVDAYNVYDVGISHALFRSTQNSTNVPVYSPGNTGINLNTNRYNYYLGHNEFTNIANGINMPVAAGAFSVTGGGSGYTPGIYVSNLTIEQNTFSAGSSSGSYVKQAINLDCANAVPPTLATTIYTPSTVGNFIQNNTFTDVFRGIAVRGFHGVGTSITQNTMSLVNDAVFSLDQHGIEISNNMSANNTSGQCKLVANTITGDASTNTVTTLYYSSQNLGYGSPSITCNYAGSSFNGFNFSGQHSVSQASSTSSPAFFGTAWRNNQMESLKRGMALTNNGVIGAQGYSLQGTGNQWLGGSTSWTGTSNGVYTYSSNALSSVLYYAALSVTDATYPFNPAGVPSFSSYASTSFTALVPTSGFNNADCGQPMDVVVPSTPDIDFGSDEQAFIADDNLYRFLRYNAAFKDSSTHLSDFYRSMSGSGAEGLAVIEEDLYAIDYAGARTKISAFSAHTTVESNYISFYSLYANYLENRSDTTAFSSADSTDLFTLAQACPEESGACIYQARALYNTIYNLVVNYYDLCDGAKAYARLAHYQQAKTPRPLNSLAKAWDVSFFPNPAANQLNVVSQGENESLAIMISDVMGRLLLKQELKTNGFIATLDLALLNGAYFISISNAQHKTVTKKLLIVK